MRRVIVTWVVALVGLGTLALAPSRSASASSADGLSGDGVIGAVVSAGSHGGGGGGGGGPTCRYEEAPGEVDSVVRQMGGTWYVLHFRTCGTDLVPVWVPQLDGEELAELALDEVRRRLPAPPLRTAPPTGRVVTQLATWVWTDPDTWRPVTATAWLPTISATATARPTRLRFEPGDGSPAVVCDGPGRVWQPADGDTASSECSHTYRHSSALSPSGRWPARLAIDWAITFSATDGTSGALAPQTTGTSTPIAVSEIQALVTGRS